jgi:formate hydrogenlyase subunit 3/multisubunit Na+/H+ antiporter MnhD subunit
MQTNLGALLLGPIFIPLLGAVFGIITARNRTIQHGIGLIAGLLSCLCSALVLLANLDPDTGILTYRLGGWLPPYGIVLVGDLLSSVFAVMATTVVRWASSTRWAARTNASATRPSCRCSCAWARDSAARCTLAISSRCSCSSS